MVIDACGYLNFRRVLVLEDVILITVIKQISR